MLRTTEVSKASEVCLEMIMRIKVIIGALILLPVMAHVVCASAISPMANYYITVDQYIARSGNMPVRVGGQVVPGSIRWDNATHTLRFQIAGDNAKIDVAYRAPAPDALRDDVTAILEGAHAADGSFLATSVLVKCPHQYLPAGW
jgi:cytochrome c-type biogenesis protein CcmE